MEKGGDGRIKLQIEGPRAKETGISTERDREGEREVEREIHREGVRHREIHREGRDTETETERVSKCFHSLYEQIYFLKSPLPKFQT